jgi:pimeloyl-ACP methyl ester carboxylesterase
MAREQTHISESVLEAVSEGPVRDQVQPIRLGVRGGEVDCRFYPLPGAQRGALWVGGAGGGWDTPAQGLYPRLCTALLEAGIASLRVRFRNPNSLPDAVFDVHAGLTYLRQQGIKIIALTGHSFGGAVVIQAASCFPPVRTVVTLATQSAGVQPVACLAPGCSILLLHGLADLVLPAECSRYTHQRAREPKHLILYPGAGHGLDEVAADVYHTVRDWIIARLTDVS